MGSLRNDVWFVFYFLFLFVSWSVPSRRQVDRDCDFLEQERIMDYSLLVGLHFRETSCRGSLTPSSRMSGGCPPTVYVLFGITFWFHGFDMNSYWRDEFIFQKMETLTKKGPLDFLAQTWISFFLILPGISNSWTLYHSYDRITLKLFYKPYNQEAILC